MDNAWRRYTQIFGEAPATHGAAGWQMNEHAFRELDARGLRYASDGREELKADGSLLRPDAGPHRLAVDGRALSCVQLPTTLPTLDEVLGRNIGGRELDRSNVADFLLGLTRQPRDHVYTLHAELEGQKLAPIFDQLLSGWRDQGYTLASMGQYYQSLDLRSLPVRPLRWGQLPGRSGDLIAA
jgi:hypothetical protein